MLSLGTCSHCILSCFSYLVLCWLTLQCYIRYIRRRRGRRVLNLWGKETSFWGLEHVWHVVSLMLVLCKKPLSREIAHRVKNVILHTGGIYACAEKRICLVYFRQFYFCEQIWGDLSFIWFWDNFSFHTTELTNMGCLYVSGEECLYVFCWNEWGKWARNNFPKASSFSSGADLTWYDWYWSCPVTGR